MIKLFWLNILVATSLVACTATNQQLISVTSSALQFPKAQYYNALIKADNDLIALVYEKGGRGSLQAYAKENDQAFAPFDFTDDPDCFNPRYDGYETLPNGHLQVWKSCLSDNGALTYLMDYDWASKKMSQIVGLLPLDTSGASWNPEQTKAIGYLDSGFATRTLFWIYPGSFAPLNLQIEDGERSWNLKDDFPDFKAEDIGLSGTTGRSVWSPDGKLIAFFASPDAVGKTKFERFGVEYYLYLLDPDTLQYHVVAKNIYSPFLMAWAPDSEHLAFIGHHGYWKENGLWLYSIADNSLSKIEKGIFQSVVWKSNNDVVAIQCQDLDLCDQIIEFRLSFNK